MYAALTQMGRSWGGRPSDPPSFLSLKAGTIFNNQLATGCASRRARHATWPCGLPGVSAAYTSMGQA